MTEVSNDQKRCVEEYLLCFGLTDGVLLGTLPGVAPVSLEANGPVEINHPCICS